MLDDQLKGERNMRYLTYIYRISYFVMFLIALIFTYLSIDIERLLLIESLGNSIDYFLSSVTIILATMAIPLVTVAYTIVSLIARIPIIGTFFAGMIGDPNNIAVNLNISIANGLFPIGNQDITNPEVAFNIIGTFITAFATTLIAFSLIAAILAGLGFLREGDSRLAITSFVGFQSTILFATLTKHLTISLAVDPTNILTYFTSEIFLLALIHYIVLEMAFQAAYALNVIEPTLLRERRIRQHLESIINFVPPSEDAIEKEDLVQSMASSQQSKRFDLLAASYLREIVEKRILRRGSQQGLGTKATMRLQSYIRGLKNHYPNLEELLTARTALPESSRVIRGSIIGIVARILIVILLGYLVLNPQLFMEPLFKTGFPQLFDSLEINEPDFRTVIIANISLAFIVAGLLLSARAERKRKEAAIPEVQKIKITVDFDETGLSGTGTTSQPTRSPTPEEEVISY